MPVEGRLRGSIFTTQDLAERLEWSTQRTRRWLQRSGAGVKRNGRVVTTPQLLARNFPELWDEIVIELPERSL